MSGGTARAEEKKKAADLPLLGPGADVMSQEDYLKVYRAYIQQSMLLGYSFGEAAATACDQSIKTLFRQAGLFTYPVPQELSKAERSKTKVGDTSVESYLHGGQLLQVERTAKEQNLLRVVWVNSSSPKAIRKLWDGAKKSFLKLQRDTRTGLELVQNVPVGYPHPYLDADGQGLYVRELKFNGKKEGCIPLAFEDNTWTHGFSLNDQRCGELRGEMDLVWAGKLKADEFAGRERQRLRENAIKSAVSRGVKREAAEQLVDKTLVPPFSHDISIVGGAMRNLSQCNLLAIGQQSGAKAPTGESGTKDGSGVSGAAGSAK